MSDQHKQVINKVIRTEKVKVLIYPITIFAILYGLWNSIYPGILNNYQVYHLISSILEPHQVGGMFIIVPILMLIGYFLNIRKLLFLSSIALLILWSTFTVAFIISPPPNTVWLLSATWTYFSFELVRRV